jgi:Fe-S cluster biogenesis protein NfuA
MVLQQSLQQAYNQVGQGPVLQAWCHNVTKQVNYHLDKIMIDPHQFLSYRTSLTGNLTQPFTIEASIQGHCQACQASTFQLLTDDSSTSSSSSSRRRTRRRGQVQQHHHHRSLSSAGAGNNVFQPTTPPLPSCACPAPLKSAFLLVANQLLARPHRVSTPVSITAIQELVQVSCSPNVTTIETYVVLNFGTPPSSSTNNTTSSSPPVLLNTTTQGQLLAQYVSQYYNNANALRTSGHVCDTSFLTVSGSAQTIVAPTGDGTSNSGISGRRRQLSPSGSVSASLTSIYKITGTCRGCSSSVSLFNDAVSKGRRRLMLSSSLSSSSLGDYNTWSDEHDDDPMDDFDEVDDFNEVDLPTMSTTMSTMTTTTNTYHHHYDDHHRQLPVLNGLCYCPVHSTSFAPPSGAEYLITLNIQLAILANAGFLSVVGPAQATVQVKPVNCSNNVETIHSIVTMTLVRVNSNTSDSVDNTTLSSDDVSFLEEAFMITYNFLAQEYYCDPFFRTVNKVQLIESIPYRRRHLMTEREMEHRHLLPTDNNFTELVFNVTSTCRGCPLTSTTLFNVNTTDDMPPPLGRRRRQLLQDHAWNALSKMSNSGEWVNNMRGLLQVQQHNYTTCYCPVHVIGNRAPTLPEFLSAFNVTIAALDQLIVSQAAEDMTIPPTTTPHASSSPSLFPTTKSPANAE